MTQEHGRVFRWQSPHSRSRSSGSCLVVPGDSAEVTAGITSPSRLYPQLALCLGQKKNVTSRTDRNPELTQDEHGACGGLHPQFPSILATGQ